jgi:hypothetical protein
VAVRDPRDETPEQRDDRNLAALATGLLLAPVARRWFAFPLTRRG